MRRDGETGVAAEWVEDREKKDGGGERRKLPDEG